MYKEIILLFIFYYLFTATISKYDYMSLFTFFLIMIHMWGFKKFIIIIYT